MLRVQWWGGDVQSLDLRVEVVAGETHAPSLRRRHLKGWAWPSRWGRGRRAEGDHGAVPAPNRETRCTLTARPAPATLHAQPEGPGFQEDPRGESQTSSQAPGKRALRPLRWGRPPPCAPSEAPSLLGSAHRCPPEATTAWPAWLGLRQPPNHRETARVGQATARPSTHLSFPRCSRQLPLECSWGRGAQHHSAQPRPCPGYASRAGSGLQEGAGPGSRRAWPPHRLPEAAEEAACTDQALRHPLGHGPFPLDPLA